MAGVDLGLRRRAFQQDMQGLVSGISGLGNAMANKQRTERQMALEEEQREKLLEEEKRKRISQAQAQKIADVKLAMQLSKDSDSVVTPDMIRAERENALSPDQMGPPAPSGLSSIFEGIQKKQESSRKRKQEESDIDLDIKREKLKQLESGPKDKKKKISGDMRKAATFAQRVQQAEDVFKKLSDKGFNRADMATSMAAGALPDFIKPESLKSQDQAERNFINAILRRESGAAIAPSEFDSAEKQYFPRAGDGPEVITQKARNRKIALGGLQAEAGETALAEVMQNLKAQENTEGGDSLNLSGIPTATASDNYVLAPEQLKKMSIEEKRALAAEKMRLQGGQ